MAIYTLCGRKTVFRARPKRGQKTKKAAPNAAAKPKPDSLKTPLNKSDSDIVPHRYNNTLRKTSSLLSPHNQNLKGLSPLTA